ncbi:hypothetical protein [Bordetella sp. N]|uniref:hypothetical protein n=1 Tax=Bordetella sp. N TaxID=1746199 RepID=UPI00070EC277|nr:hypothetical protein [Bordetella sp. N]ALM81750.1 hypothetical protein ASB57_01120 [Bordetella sp. N]
MKSLISRVLGWLAWWRRPDAVSVAQLDAHTMRDIGVPPEVRGGVEAEKHLSQVRDRGPAMW